MSDQSRPSLVKHAVQFLTNPLVGVDNLELKIAFLKAKGLTDEEVSEAISISNGAIVGVKR